MFLFNFIKNKPLQYSIIVYIISLLIINMIKPKMIFIEDKKKEFGIGNNKTLFPYMVQCLLLSIFVYLVFNLV